MLCNWNREWKDEREWCESSFEEGKWQWTLVCSVFFLSFFLAPDRQRGWMDRGRKRETGRQRGERAGGEYTLSSHIVLVCFPHGVFIFLEHSHSRGLTLLTSLGNLSFDITELWYLKLILVILLQNKNKKNSEACDRCLVLLIFSYYVKWDLTVLWQNVPWLLSLWKTTWLLYSYLCHMSKLSCSHFSTKWQLQQLGCNISYLWDLFNISVVSPAILKIKVLKGGFRSSVIEEPYWFPQRTFSEYFLKEYFFS